jgi:dipeptidyl aminopeptidase/acylaminoacyl peptidase
VDVRTGERRLVAENVQAEARLSPAARYAYWWDRSAATWRAVPASGGATLDLAAGVPHALGDETHDQPFPANPYGAAGWTDGDAEFLFYDRYDVWAADPARPGQVRALTAGAGRTRGVRYRVVDLDPDEEALDFSRPLTLSVFHEETKDAGFARVAVRGGAPEELVMMDRRFTGLRKAPEADRLLFQRESVAEFPDLWTADLDFRQPLRVTEANPQQARYRWATSERITWTSLTGLPLEGILYRPEGFDPAGQHPLLVYFYDRHADGLHRHYAPAPHRSVIDPVFYASRGYVVFVPDIAYEEGYPGQSAYNSIMPGVTRLTERPYIDGDRVGVQGHSWGGYQIAYLVTRTNLFRAAAAGAPVANMTSAYGGIRWETGRSRMFQYERTQSRIGGTLWERPVQYLENSPLFSIDRVETPVLIMHNDRDGHVPFEQGVELFLALYRLGKPAWLVNYNEEPHWPTKYHLKVDWQMRLQQFFDHYLLDAPAPRWLAEGIPATEKGRTLGFEGVETALE